MGATLLHARGEIATALSDRREEIEQATLARVYGVSEPTSVDPEYLRGLRVAVAAALGYFLSAVEGGEDRAPPIPPILRTQARLAARNGIGVDTVLRRYLAGYSLLSEYVVFAVEEADLGPGVGVAELLQGNASLFDRLLEEVSEEHRRESAILTSSIQRGRLERVRRLLAGEQIDVTDLCYEMEAFHVALIGSGSDVEQVVRDLATRCDMRLLLVHCDSDTLWAWLGTRRRLERPDLELLVRRARRLASESGEILAFGEPGHGPGGWRLTHRQAKAVLPVARESSESVVRYAEAAMLATVIQDDVMATSLRELYLRPLRAGPDDGAVLRATLSAYFSARGRISSTASALGVTRRTVGNRLRTVEERLGRTVDAYAAEIQTALQLAELEESAGPPTKTAAP